MVAARQHCHAGRGDRTHSTNATTTLQPPPPRGSPLSLLLLLAFSSLASLPALSPGLLPRTIFRTICYSRRQFAAFEAGFRTLCDVSSFEMFRAEELELLICGAETLDFDELESAARYEDGYEVDRYVSFCSISLAFLSLSLAFSRCLSLCPPYTNATTTSAAAAAAAAATTTILQPHHRLVLGVCPRLPP